MSKQSEETPVMWKLVEIQETFYKAKDGKVYWKWRFATKKRWNYRLTAMMDTPYVVLRAIAGMPHPLVHSPESIKARVEKTL
jgi:hypothetical protein